MAKYYIVREWKDFDNGGMDFLEFCSVGEAEEWLLKEYPGGLSGEDLTPKIIRGELLNIVERETKVVKSYSF